MKLNRNLLERVIRFFLSCQSDKKGPKKWNFKQLFYKALIIYKIVALISIIMINRRKYLYVKHDICHVFLVKIALILPDIVI
jgi:hypothetical protein